MMNLTPLWSLVVLTVQAARQAANPTYFEAHSLYRWRTLQPW